MDGIRISWYALFALIGMLAGFFLCLFWHDENVKKVDVVCGYLFSLLGLVFGAKILYIVTNLQSIQIAGVFDFLIIVFTGFSFYGAIAGSMGALFGYCKFCKIDFGKMAGMLMVAICAIYLFARIGCALTGCCYGIPYDGVCAVIGRDGLERFPVQLLDSGLHAFILLILLVCRKYKKNVVAVFLLLHGADRFMLEFLRDEAMKSLIGGLSVNQWISILIFPGILIWYVMGYIGKKKAPL